MADAKFPEFEMQWDAGDLGCGSLVIRLRFLLEAMRPDGGTDHVFAIGGTDHVFGTRRGDRPRFRGDLAMMRDVP